MDELVAEAYLKEMGETHVFLSSCMKGRDCLVALDVNNRNK